MRILIGIYQNQDEASTFYQSQSVEASGITEVGPFFSRDQALSWMEYLMSKLTDCEKAFVPEVETENESWYGFTCEVNN